MLPKSIFQSCAGMVLALLLVLGGMRSHGAGVTIITHGLNSDVDGWVIAMADRMAHSGRFPGTNSSCYEIYFVATNSSYAVTWKRLSGVAATNSDSGEIFIKLDWRQLANNSYSTFQVAAMVTPVLLQTNFIPEMGGHALAELPLHMIGHSRGGSLISEISRLLGTNGVWVDHLTTLDPHPLNNDGFNDIIYTVVDAPVRTYENVLFHDNYYQRLDSFAYGEPVGGSYVRQLTSLNGGYSGFGGAHSDVHLWYHGTVDTNTPAFNSDVYITSTERQSWWTAAERAGTQAGFLYSRLAGGDRLSTNQPAGAARIRDGYNRKWDLGGGSITNNRTALTVNNGSWPSPIKLRLEGTNIVAFGQSNLVALNYQWAKTNFGNATLSFYLDPDRNPYNGNERLISEHAVAGTGSNQVAFLSVPIVFNASNSIAGENAVFARITAGGGMRYLYAPEKLTILSSFQPPNLALQPAQNGGVLLQVTGVPGQRIHLQQSHDLATWQTISTNWLTTTTISFNQGAALPKQFFRAVVR